MQRNKVLKKIVPITAVLVLLACSGSASNKEKAEKAVDVEGNVVEVQAEQAAVMALPYSDESVREHVVMNYGNRTIRTDADKTISEPQLVKNKQKCFIVMSKKDYYLYVYEAQAEDTVLVARYDCCFALKKGNKERQGDMRTPHCTMKTPFSISQIADASTWSHDFGDGRGSIKSYGDYFLRLVTPGHKGIGIHGSTNNSESVPGRASEGCIRLKDEDIIDLRKNYAFVGMKVVIKAENVDDLPFEIRAMEKQKIQRKRHFDPSKTLTNEQIQQADAEQGRVKGQRHHADAEIPIGEEEIGNNAAASNTGGSTKNMTLEELKAHGR